MTRVTFADYTKKRFYNIETEEATETTLSKVWYIIKDGVAHKFSFSNAVDSLIAREAAEKAGYSMATCILPEEYEIWKKPVDISDITWLLASVVQQSKTDNLFLVSQYDKASKILKNTAKFNKMKKRVKQK